MLELPTRGKGRLRSVLEFAQELQKIQSQLDFKVSARGWCYQLEQFGLITKAEFDKVENLINKECRQRGYLPIDFVAEEEARKFSGVEIPEGLSPLDFIKNFLDDVLIAERYYTPDWWTEEEYYIQMVVEKIDLKSLFEPVCKEYHIPIATSKGWSSMLQRAEYARRFREAEDKGLKCVLLYCGDHDPDGLRISEFLRSNLDDLRFVVWGDGTDGYDPYNLIIDRFGLNYDFIIENNLSWVENLITGSGKNLASPGHPNHYMDYVQRYLQEVGARKCEANSLVVAPVQGRDLCRETIVKYLGEDAIGRFQERWQAIKDEMDKLRDNAGLDEAIQNAIDIIGE
jgi:hypothetical protein